MRRLLTGLLLAAALVGTAAAAQPARVLAVEWEAGGGKLRWVSPTTLQPVGPAALNVGGAPANVVAVSPDKKLAAIGGGIEGRLRFVRLASLRQQGLLWLRGRSVLKGIWSSPQRLVVLLGDTSPEVVVIEPSTRKIIRREQLGGVVTRRPPGRRSPVDARDAACPDRSRAPRGDRRRRLGPDRRGPGHHGRDRATGEARRRGEVRVAGAGRERLTRGRAGTGSARRDRPREPRGARATARHQDHGPRGEADRGLVASRRLARREHGRVLRLVVRRSGKHTTTGVRIVDVATGATRMLDAKAASLTRAGYDAPRPRQRPAARLRARRHASLRAARRRGHRLHPGRGSLRLRRQRQQHALRRRRRHRRACRRSRAHGQADDRLRPLDSAA